MYLDYDDSTPRTHENLFGSTWKDLGMAAGTGLGGYATRKAGIRMRRSGMALQAEAKGEAASFNKGVQRSINGSSVYGFSKKLTSAANIFGWTSMARMAFSGTSSALRSGGAFRTTKEELAKQNFNSMNDQDTYYDTRAAYTQRQRALQVIHNSRLSLKPMLGSESNYLHY